MRDRKPHPWEPDSFLEPAIIDLVEYGSVYIDAHVNLAELQELFPQILVRELGDGVKFIKDTGADRARRAALRFDRLPLPQGRRSARGGRMIVFVSGYIIGAGTGLLLLMWAMAEKGTRPASASMWCPACGSPNIYRPEPEDRPVVYGCHACGEMWAMAEDTGPARDAWLPCDSTGYRYHRADVAPEGDA